MSDNKLKYSTPTELFQEIATLRASLAEAKQEARGWKLRVDEAAEVVGRLEQERDAARAEAKRMREALERYGKHDENCQAACSCSGIHICSCGFTALSAPTEKPCNCGFDPGRCRTHNSTSTPKPDANRTGE